MRDFQLPGRSPVFGQNGMCATSNPLAAKTAIDVLEAGGNAADAATAAAILLGFCEPQMTGLGGDMFALIKPAGSEDVIGLNASGRAPAALSADAIRAAGHSEIPLYNALAVTVPGAVDGFFRLVEDHGSKPMAELLAPSIRYAEEGVPVGPRTAHDWEIGFAQNGQRGACRVLRGGCGRRYGCLSQCAGRVSHACGFRGDRL